MGLGSMEELWFLVPRDMRRPQAIVRVRSFENSCTTDRAARGGWMREGQRQGQRITNVRSQGIRRRGKSRHSPGKWKPREERPWMM